MLYKGREDGDGDHAQDGGHEDGGRADLAVQAPLGDEHQGHAAYRHAEHDQADRGQILLDGVKKYNDQYAFHACKAEFALASLGNDAGAYGAFKLALDAFA